MRRFLSTIAIVLIGNYLALAQEAGASRQEIGLQQAVMQPFAFLSRGPTALQWHPDGQRVTFLKRQSEGPVLVATNIIDGKSTTLLSQADLAKASQAIEVSGLNMGDLRQAKWSEDGSKLRFISDGRLFHLDITTKTLTAGLSFPADAEANTWDSNDFHVAYSKDKNVYVVKPDGTTFQITEGGFDFLTHGLSVSRVEFGITDGMWWAPKGGRLAFYREDLRPIQPYPYVDWKVRPAEHKLGRYPMAGHQGSRVDICVYNVRDDSLVWLKVDPKVDQYLTNITWGPEGEKLYIAHVNRAQNQMDLKIWDAKTGSCEGTLFTEKDAEWTEPEHGPIFLKDGSGDFLWFSPRDGFNHLYLYTSDGHLLQQVTKGKFDIDSFEGFTSDGFGIYVKATGDNPLEMHLFAASLAPQEFRAAFQGEGSAMFEAKSPSMIQLTQGRGRHNASMSSTDQHALDIHSNVKQPMVAEIIAMEDLATTRLHEAPNPWQRFKGGQEELFTVKAKDGRDLHGHIILPSDLDESKKYPVLLYVYAGPHSQLVTDTFSGGASFSSGWFHYMANQGFIVMRIDGHGTANRGIDFVQSIHRNLGELEVEDQIIGLEHLLSRPYADGSRVGVHGWSYGGYMTLSLMTRAGDYF